MNATLIRNGPPAAGETLRLDEFPVLIGRSPEADIQLNDHWVSRFHCAIDECGGMLVVRDLGSQNGTLVNDASIRETQLLPGDHLVVGLSTFRIEYERSSPVSLSARPPRDHRAPEFEQH